MTLRAFTLPGNNFNINSNGFTARLVETSIFTNCSCCRRKCSIISPLPSWDIEEIDPRVAKIGSGSIGIDTHNHIDVPFKAEKFRWLAI